MKTNQKKSTYETRNGPSRPLTVARAARMTACIAMQKKVPFVASKSIPRIGSMRSFSCRRYRYVTGRDTKVN